MACGGSIAPTEKHIKYLFSLGDPQLFQSSTICKEFAKQVLHLRKSKLRLFFWEQLLKATEHAAWNWHFTRLRSHWLRQLVICPGINCVQLGVWQITASYEHLSIQAWYWIWTRFWQARHRWVHKVKAMSSSEASLPSSPGRDTLRSWRSMVLSDPLHSLLLRIPKTQRSTDKRVHQSRAVF